MALLLPKSLYKRLSSIAYYLCIYPNTTDIGYLSVFGQVVAYSGLGPTDQRVWDSLRAVFPQMGMPLSTGLLEGKAIPKNRIPNPVRVYFLATV